MRPIDRSYVFEGYPSEPGLYLLWSDSVGWPVIDIIRVEVRDGRPVFYKGTDGTDRNYEIRQMCGIAWDRYLGHSPASQEALGYYEERWQEASLEVKALLAKWDAINGPR